MYKGEKWPRKGDAEKRKSKIARQRIKLLMSCNGFYSLTFRRRRKNGTDAKKMRKTHCVKHF